MKRLLNWRVVMAVVLIALSAGLYFLHFKLFHDAHHIFIYFVGDVAFIPIEVLLVTIIIHHLLEKREKRALLHKMNMLISAFFSDTGVELLREFSKFDTGVNRVRDILKPAGNWNDSSFTEAKNILKKDIFKIDLDEGDLEGLKSLLASKKDFLLSLLANPNLLEHDTFTDLLWAVFHLADELAKRKEIKGIPEADQKHLEGDITRAYKVMISEWLDYMKHLKNDYPYLFSLAVRTNPFDLNAEVELKEA